MDGPRRREGRGSLVWLLPAAIVVLLWLYPLSLGPAIVWHRSTSSEFVHTALEGFYGPLEWLHENTPLRGPLDWYVALWER